MPDVASAFGDPGTFNPDGTAMGWTAIAAGDPDVAMAVPAMVAGNPDPIAMRCDGDDFHGTRRGWADADDDLCVGCTYGEKESAYSGQDLFLHFRALLEFVAALQYYCRV